MVYIIHRWYGNSLSDWIPWLRQELESRGIVVVTPNMPNTNRPKISEWVTSMPSIPAWRYPETYFIGHSIGCQTVLRYLELLPEGCEVGGVVFVAPWTKLTNLEKGEPAIAKEWLATPIDWDEVRTHSRKFTAIFSDNDPYVPLENAKTFEENLGAKLVMEMKKGHFTEEDGITKLPALLDEVLEIING